jgi:SNF2 family DNA or RNA helicase
LRTAEDTSDAIWPSSLRDYQREGVHFLLSHESALLADEMGLGKTVQVSVALSLLYQNTSAGRTLIVVPASLSLNWEREIMRWAPRLSVRRVEGSTRDRLYQYRLPYKILIASYEQLRSDARKVSSLVRFGVLVLDESQRIKNPDSSTALACRIIRRDRSWALTGTPIENSVDDLVSLFRFVRPGLLQLGMTRSEMHNLMQPHFLRRRKSEVLQNLPPIITQDLPLELTGHQREVYDDFWLKRDSLLPKGEGAQETHLFALITKLKQLCNYDPASQESSKLEALKLIIEGLAPDDKLLIFSQYVETLQWLATKINGLAPCEVFHGGLSQADRDEVLSRFRQSSGSRVLLISLRAGAVGLNLQEATSVVLFDRWWNPALEAQAINRAHRFGREKVLQVFRFLVEDSIEERIAEVLSHKTSLFETYVDEAENAEIPRLTRADLLTILGFSDSQEKFGAKAQVGTGKDERHD